MATVPTPATQTAGTVVPAATINSQGNLATYLAGRTESGGARRPFCVMRQTSAQSIPNATATAVTFDVEDVDYDNGHSTVTNTSRYTAGTAGWYDVKYIAAFVFNATGQRQAWLRINGTTAVPSSAVQQNATAAGASEQSGSRPVFLNAGDYIELIVLQNSTGALNTQAGTGQEASMMSVEWRSV